MELVRLLVFYNLKSSGALSSALRLIAYSPSNVEIDEVISNIVFSHKVSGVDLRQTRL